MRGRSAKWLVIGYGNPGRCDDGLGPRAAESIAAWNLAGVTVESDYQLQVEDAWQVAQHDGVVFVDASCDALEPFEFEAIEPRNELSFSSHALEPADVLGLARGAFDADVRAHGLWIRGYEWNAFEERLSERAHDNLQEALAFLRHFLEEEHALVDALAASDGRFA